MTKVITTFIIAAAITAGVIGLLHTKGCIDGRKVKNTIRKVIVQRSDSIQYYKDFAGREHARRVQVEAERDLADIFYGEIIDSIAKANKIKTKQLEGFTAIGTEQAGTVEAITDTIIIDSTKSIRIRYADKWITITGIAGKRSTIDYSIKDSLVVSTYWKRKWLLGKKTTYIDAYSINPKVRITGMQGVKIIEQRRKPFGVGPYVGYGFDGTKWRPSVGIALTYDLIKF